MKLKVYVCLSLCLVSAGGVLIRTTRPATKNASHSGDSAVLSRTEHSPEAVAKASSDENKARLVDFYGRLPLSFEANRGQTDPQVKFVSRGQGYTLFLTRHGEAVLALRKPASQRDSLKPASLVSMLATLNPDPAGPPAIVRMKLVGANAKPRAEALGELPGKANYFIGNDPKKWRTNVPLYAKVRYREVYPGVDLVYHGNQQQLEHDFVVAPGADPRSITLNLAGTEKLSLDPQGALVLAVKDGELRLDKPRIYQEVDGVRREVSGGYVLKGTHQVHFKVAAYDASRPLVIDPVLFYSTYLGGASEDQAAGGVTADSSGNAYICGYTDSANFPITSGAFQTSLLGFRDGFVTKLNPTGSSLVYSTYLGGSGGDSVGNIAIDSAGNAYVVGETTSSDFPITPGAFQPTAASGDTGFVAKLNASGSALIYSTYLGGSGRDAATGVAIDGSGNAFVAGDTSSTDFPTTPGAFQPTYPGGPGDVFVSKLNATGSSLVYSTYLGASSSGGTDTFHGIAVDSAGFTYVTGNTTSTSFPTTLGAFQTAFAGGSSDGFVAKLNVAGSALVYSTYVGGNGEDVLVGIALDSAGNVYSSGYTSSTNFPVTPGAFQTTFGGYYDAVVIKLNPSGSAPVYATYLGGDAFDGGAGIAVDSVGNAYVTGSTSSSNFPTVNAIQPTLGGGSDAFVTKVNPLGSGLVYSTYLGGSSDDSGGGIALDSLPIPNAYVTGRTLSTNFPTTSGAFQTSYGGGASDAFVTKISEAVVPPPPTVGKVTGGGTVDVTGGIANFGFIVQAQSSTGPIGGDLQYVNHASGAKIHSVAFTTFTISGNTATFSGTCTNNGVPCTFAVTVQDNDQPPGTDSFVISIDGGPPEGGTLRSGDIEIHQQ
jgi:Beta-propeller repeat